MKKTILNIAALLVIGFGGYTLTTPAPALACPECRTCTGGCTGCFGDDCGGSEDFCGLLQSQSTGEFIECNKGEAEANPDIG
ncbi:MAG: hypothetical protein ACNA78_04180 [Balneolaceae bacterium]